MFLLFRKNVHFADGTYTFVGTFGTREAARQYRDDYLRHEECSILAQDDIPLGPQKEDK